MFNGVFAALQIALGLGIAWPPAVRVALASSVAWSTGVWWLGEGLGGVLTSTASPLTGAPGAVILYALLAVLLWSAARDRPAPFVAAGAVGRETARVLWMVLWASLAFFALLPASRAPGAVSVFLPARAARAGVALAVTVAAFIWLAEGLGGVFTGSGTDPNSGPLLALLGIAFWPGPAPWRSREMSPREGA